MRRSSAQAAIGLIACGMLITAPIAHAWESDFHKGLTRWLAVKAGFAPNHADKLARFNEQADQNVIHNPILQTMHAMLSGNPEVSAHVQELHFPSAGPIPSEPKRRTVSPDPRVVRKQLELLIGEPENDPEYDLRKLGLWLHALQDSWSHQGEPDTPLRCFGPIIHPDLSWGHPMSRGSWFLHDSDLTYVYPGDAETAARASFDVLRAFLKTHGSYGSLAAGSDWPAIRVEVMRFVQASSKQDKSHWLQNAGFARETAEAIASRTTLGNGPLKSAIAAARKFGGPCPTDYKTWQIVAEFREISVAARAFVDETLRLWFVARNVLAVVERTASQLVSQQLAGRGLDPQRAQAWLRKLFTSFTLADHGFVNMSGHGDPDAPGYQSLPENPNDAAGAGGTATYESLAAAMIWPQQDSPYRIYPVSSSDLPQGSLVVTFRLRHAPNDTVLLLIGPERSGWLIRGVGWLVD